MSTTISDRVAKLANLLFSDSEDQEIFYNSIINKKAGRSLNIHAQGQLNTSLEKIPSAWTSHWSISEGDGDKDSYSMDCSSIFMVSPLIEFIDSLVPNRISVCDACAAPGGKSFLAYTLCHPKLLLANEKAQSRIKALISNFSKHQLHNSAVISEELKRLATLFPNSFDIVLLDAPCSGQSMLARGVNNPSSLTRIAIDRASNTQKGLINNAAKIVTPGGHLLYSTCTYSRDENEKVIEWFIRKNPEYSTVKINHLKDFQSQFSELACYRLWPHQGLGSGGFTCLLINNSKNRNSTVIDLNLIKKSALWQSLN